MADNGDAEKAEEPAQGRTPGASGANEWTLSDSRGPLEAAQSERGKAGSASAAEGGTAVPASGTASQRAGTDEAAHDEAAAPTSETPAAEPLAEPARRPVPVLPVIAALVVGAVIGAGSAGIVYKSADQGASQSDVNALASRVDALEKRRDPQPEMDQLKASLAKTAAAPKAPAFDPTPLQQRLASLESEVGGLKKQDAAQGLADKVSALDATVSGLKSQGADVKGLDDKVAALGAAVDGLKKQDATTQAGISDLQSGQKELEGKAGAPALAVVADSLVEAIAGGKPYAGQVDAAATLGADPAKVAVLRENAERGVPSARVLASKFAPLADPIAASGSHAPANAGLVDRLKSGMLSMVSVRRADTTSGDDPASRVSRIEADLAHDDVAGAYATWQGLPPEAKAKSDAWGALAKTQAEAMAAARALQQQAIAALGGKKS